MIQRLRIALWLAGPALLVDLCAVVPGLHRLGQYRAVQRPDFDYLSAVLFDGRRFLGMFFNLPLVCGAGLAGVVALFLARPAFGRSRDSGIALAIVLLLVPVANVLPLVLLWGACLWKRSVLVPAQVAGAGFGAGAPEGPILPRIKTRTFVDAARRVPGMTEDNMPLFAEIAGDLIVSFAIDAGDSFVGLSAKLCAQRGLMADDLMQLAMNNAAPALRTLQLDEDGPVFHIRGAEGSNDLEACVILDSFIWQAAALRLQDAPVAIVPHRNAVHYTAAGSAEGLAALRAILARTDFNATHALSRQLYVWRDQSWSVFAG